MEGVIKIFTKRVFFAFSLIMTGLICLGSVTPGWAQQVSRVQGVVLDDQNEPLPGATIYLHTFRSGQAADSLYTSSGPDGAFLFKSVRADSVRLRVTFIGFVSFEETYEISSEAILELPNIRMQASITDLEETQVRAARSELEIKGDTLAFTASTFPVRPGATLGELLRRLPGIEIDEQGNITFNGKRVTRVMIEGREYFGGDPALASGAIPVNIINKVEVMDTRTLEEEFTGRTPSGDDKTINLTLREDAPKVFGKVGGGYGTDRRYDASGTLNYIDGPTQANLLGFGNNVNKMSFQQGSQMQSATFASEGTGITDTQSGGFNMSHKWDSNTEMGGSYFYDQSASGQATSRQRRQNILADSTFLQTTLGDLSDDNHNHRLNLNFRFRPDSTSALSITPSVSQRNYTRMDTQINTTSTSGGDPLNEGESLNRSSGQSGQAAINFFYSKNLGGGSSLSLLGGGNWSGQDGDDLSRSAHTYYTSGQPDTTDIINQMTHRESNNGSYSASINWGEILSQNLRLDVAYRISYDRSASDQSAFNYNPSSEKYDQPDLAFTNRLESTTVMHIPSAALSLNLPEKGLQINAGASLSFTTLDHKNSVLDDPIRLRQLNVGPQMSMNYRVGENKTLGLVFTADTRPPSIEQLQPAPDNTNPLLIRKGNSNLKSAFSQTYRLNYNAYNITTSEMVVAGLSYSPALGSIVPSVTYEPNGRQTISYVNADGAYVMSANLNYNRRLIFGEHRLRLGAGVNGSFNNNVSVLNGEESHTNTANLGPSLSVTYSLGQLITLATTWRPMYQRTEYGSSLPNRITDEYIRHHLSNNLTVQWPKNIRLESDLNYRHDGGLPAGFQKNTVMWNAALAWQVLPKGELKLSVYDLLGQNTNLYRTTGEYFIEDVQTTTLQRYVLLSFIWNIGAREG